MALSHHSGAERRRYPRKDFATPVHLVAGDRQFSGTMRNISVGGLCFIAELQLKVRGGKVESDSVMDTLKPLEADTVVQVSAPQLGLAGVPCRVIRFDPLDNGFRVALEFQMLQHEVIFRLLDKLLKKR